MGFVKANFTNRYVFDALIDEPIIHGIFTREGGVSPEPWNSLNLGGLNGDTRENVVENRRRIFDDINRDVRSVFDVWQVHSCDVICSNQARPLDEMHKKADAILTDNPEITLMMRFADCVPLLFFDPVARVVGIAHAGWQGTVKNIAGATVDAMEENYQSKPSNIIVGIGPSIGADHYEVGEDVVQQVRIALRNDIHGAVIDRDGHTYLDLWEVNRRLLHNSGIQYVYNANICTACDTTRWYSHRAEKGKTGRFGAVIALKE